MATFKPNYLKTPAERAETSRKFDNLYVRPYSDDWEWWDNSDYQRIESKPKPREKLPNMHNS